MSSEGLAEQLQESQAPNTSPSSPYTLRKMEEGLSDSLNREVDAVCRHLSTTLSVYPELECYLPLNAETIFDRLRDGILLGYLLYHYYPESIQVNQLVRGMDLSLMDQPYSKVTYEVNSNLNNVITAAKSVKGLVIINLGAEDILHGHRDLILGLLWQIFNSKLSSSLSLHAHPELIKLVESNESLLNLASLKPEALLFRWFNYHLQKTGGAHKKVTNFTKDLSDSELLAVLMCQVSSNIISNKDVDAIKQLPCGSVEEKLERAKLLVSYATKLGCNEFISAENIVHGHARLNFAFTATLFNHFIGIKLPSEDEMNALSLEKDNAVLEKQQMQVKLETVELAFASHQESSATEIADLRAAISKYQDTHAKEMEAMQSAFDDGKEELASQYKDSLESALESERRVHQEQLWELVSQQKELRRRIVTMHSQVRAHFDAEDIQTGKISDLFETADLDTCVNSLNDATSLLTRKLQTYMQIVDNLRNTVAHKEKVNELMGDKIREYTEQVITVKKGGDKGRRGSILRRIFALERK